MLAKLRITLFIPRKLARWEELQLAVFITHIAYLYELVKKQIFSRGFAF